MASPHSTRLLSPCQLTGPGCYWSKFATLWVKSRYPCFKLRWRILSMLQRPLWSNYLLLRRDWQLGHASHSTRANSGLRVSRDSICLQLESGSSSRACMKLLSLKTDLAVRERVKLHTWDFIAPFQQTWCNKASNSTVQLRMLMLSALTQKRRESSPSEGRALRAVSMFKVNP